MKKFLILIIALAASAGSAWYVWTTVSPLATPETVGELSGSSSSSAATNATTTVSLDDEAIDAAMQASQSSESSSAMSSSMAASSASSVSGTAAKATPAYALYAEGMVGNGQTSVLFFYAPTVASTASQQTVKALYASGKASIPTFRVDFDAAATLRKTFGVTASNTFVKIDGSGTAQTTIQDPSSSDLEALLR